MSFRAPRFLPTLTVAFLIAGFSLVFFWTPNDADQGFIQKIFYLHVPLASMALIGFIVAAVQAILHLRTGLSKWDVRRIKEGLRCPVLALASRDDPIVPESMSEAIWGNHGIVWSPDGGHVLPLMHPRWCARHVLEFARALPS